MKASIKLIFAAISVMILNLICSSASAQGFSGVATYQYNSKVNIFLDSTKMPPDQMKQIQEQVRQQMQKEFELTFTATESSWKQLESLSKAPAPTGGGNQVVILDGAQNSILYKNISTRLYEQSEDALGKSYIVKDSLETYAWKLTNETKQIGKFQCQKAVFQKVVDSKFFGTGMKEMTVTKDTIETEAWYTMEIPVGHGPATAYGLPGLILELKTGGRTYLCTKVVLNPATPVQVEIPKKGKTISQAEFKKLKEEEMESTMKRYNSSGAGDQKIEIKIGG